MNRTLVLGGAGALAMAAVLSAPAKAQSVYEALGA